MMQFRHTKTLSSNFKTEGTGRVSQRVNAMAWSPDGMRLAVALPDRNIYLFDDKYELIDKFPTKRADKDHPREYTIRGLQFSPNSDRLAVFQSDDIIYVYKLGNVWGHKKSICNKYSSQVPNTPIVINRAITCICWPTNRLNDIAYGLANGEMKAGTAQNNAVNPLFTCQSAPVSMVSTRDGAGFVSAHMDGSVVKFIFPTETTSGVNKTLAQLPFTPLHVVVGEHVIVHGVNDHAIPVPQGSTIIGLNINPNNPSAQIPAGTNMLYICTEQGEKVQMIAFKNNEDDRHVPSRPFSSCSMSPSGQMVVFGSYNRIEAFGLSANTNSGGSVFGTKQRQWEHVKKIATIESLLNVSASTWSPNGSSLITGATGGALDVFEVCLRKDIYLNKYELIYTSSYSVIVRTLATDVKIAIQSKHKSEIQRVNVYHDRYIVANTSTSLIVGDMKRGLVSEVLLTVPLTQQPDGTTTVDAKFFFDSEQACIVYCNSELHVIEYGLSQILTSVRTECVSPYLLSLSFNNNNNNNNSGVNGLLVGEKRLAYLLDRQTIRVVDMSAQTTLTSINHAQHIDWVELSPSGTKLLFRDRQHNLVLVDVQTQQKTTLLSGVSYAQWVPQSDVAVGCTNTHIHVWYNIDAPSDASTIPYTGQVVDLERSEQSTVVVVDTGLETTRIPLNDLLISFGAAMRSQQLTTAAQLLESIPVDDTNTGTASTMQQSQHQSIQTMWSALAKVSLQKQDFSIATQCYSALHDISKSVFIDKLLKLNRESSASSNLSMLAHANSNNNALSPIVQAWIHVLNKQIKMAISLLLERGLVDECIAMCKSIHKWKDAVHIAETRNHPQLGALYTEYYNYLLQTHQQDTAGELKEKQGDITSALQLYIQGNNPVKAAQLLMKHNMLSDAIMCDNVCELLLRIRCYDVCGDLYIARRMFSKALDVYKQGHLYAKALELCRSSFPNQLVLLEEEWGDYLVSQRQYDAASSHFMEAHNYMKAVHSCIESKQWSKAVSIITLLDPRDAQPYYRKLGHYYAQHKKYSDAEKMYLDGGFPQEAVQMYTRQSMWDKAYNIAKTFMRQSELVHLYVSQAQVIESNFDSNNTNTGKLAEAEKLYIAVGEVDRAIEMYKRHHFYDDMIRLVEEYRSELLVDTYLHLARKFEKDDDINMAEEYFLKAGEWRSCVAMYREKNDWMACLRIAKSHGGPVAFKQVAYAYATNINSTGTNNSTSPTAGVFNEEGVQFLVDNGLGEQAVDFAVERAEWDSAVAIATKACPVKLPEVYLQLAMSLEDDGHFEDAEVQFLKANKPREAIEMYLHQKDWDRASRIAQQYDPASMDDIMVAQARVCVEEGKYSTAETLFIQAQQPQHAVNMYKEAKMYEDGLRVAQVHVPREVPLLQRELFRMNGQQHQQQQQQQQQPQAMSQQPQQQQPQQQQQLDLIAQGKKYEQDRNYKLAIETYVKLNKSHVSPALTVNTISTALVHTSVLASQVLSIDERDKVLDTIVATLIDLEQYMPAANVLSERGQHQQAVRMLCQHKQFTQAEQIAMKTRERDLMEFVEQQRQQTLKSENKIQELSERNVDMAVQVYIQSNQWGKVLQLAQQQQAQSQDKTAVGKYAINHAGYLVNNGQYRLALAVLAQYGYIMSPSNLILFKRVAEEVIHISEPQGPSSTSRDHNIDTPSQEQSWVLLRQWLFKVVADIDVGIENNSLVGLNNDQIQAVHDLKRHLTVAHLYHNQHLAQQQKQLPVVAAKISMSLLRYCRDLPVDHAFYNAGRLCQAASQQLQQQPQLQQQQQLQPFNSRSMLSNAIVFYNRFIDISDAIEEGSAIDNKDFQYTDIPNPSDMALPKKQCVSTGHIEEVRDWVLEKAMESSAQTHTLSQTRCGKCNRDTYSGNLTCHVCRFKHEQCVLTGFPLSSNTAHTVSCTSCSKKMIKYDFNSWINVMGTCPWCQQAQQPQF